MSLYWMGRSHSGLAWVGFQGLRSLLIPWKCPPPGGHLSPIFKVQVARQSEVCVLETLHFKPTTIYGRWGVGPC